MAWIVENRRSSEALATADGPFLTEEMKLHLAAVYLPRYPTKKAVLLPGLHLVQHHYGWIPPAALKELAEFLEVSPAEALDTASFYEEYWLKPKGKYLIGVCRSLTCEICGSSRLTDHLRRKLKIEPGETTTDKRFTLIEMECLGSCGTAPAALFNEVLHEELTVETLDKLIAGLPEDPVDYRDPSIDWKEAGHEVHGHAAVAKQPAVTEAVTVAVAMPAVSDTRAASPLTSQATDKSSVTTQNSGNNGECDIPGPLVFDNPKA